jgi:hypothetical protein
MIKNRNSFFISFEDLKEDKLVQFLGFVCCKLWSDAQAQKNVHGEGGRRSPGGILTEKRL